MIFSAATSRLIGALGLALVLSLGINAWQLYRAGKAEGTNAGELERATLAGRIAQLREASEASGALIAQGRADHATLLAELEAIAERGQQVRVVYRTAAAAAPLPVNCAPGAARVDAVNAALGPVTGGRR